MMISIFCATVGNSGLVENKPAEQKPQEQKAAEDQYSAIAFSRTTLAYGSSIDFANQAAADRKATNECEKSSGNDDCKVVVQFKNGCGVVTLGDKAYGIGSGPDAKTAVLNGFEDCLKYTDNCRLLKIACTSNVPDPRLCLRKSDLGQFRRSADDKRVFYLCHEPVY